MADNIAGQMQGIPMSELIGAPLTAVCDAQAKLAKAQYDFIMNVAFKSKEGGGVDEEQARLLKFKLQRPVENTGGGIDVVDTEVQAPFLGLVPIPCLLVEDVNIEFQMEVSATAATKEKLDAESSMNATASGGFGPVRASVQVQGKVTSSRENTRSTNQTAKYNVRVSARQQQPTEGLSRLMDIMAQCTAPIPTSK